MPSRYRPEDSRRPTGEGALLRRLSSVRRLTLCGIVALGVVGNGILACSRTGLDADETIVVESTIEGGSTRPEDGSGGRATTTPSRDAAAPIPTLADAAVPRDAAPIPTTTSTGPTQQPPAKPPATKPPAKPPVANCTPHDETCNGVDDDCNGKVDDDLAPVPCTGGGEQYCVAGRFSACPMRCETCIPGSERVCFLSYCTYWATETCAADGRSFGTCREHHVPPECADIASAHKDSAALEQCCIDQGYCCHDEYDLDHDGNRSEMVGSCDEVSCGM